MSREELIEGIIMILIIIGFWPVAFLGWFPEAYKYTYYGISGVLVFLIFLRRLARVRAGLKYSRQMRDLRDQAESGGRPMPFMPPEESDSEDEQDGRP